MKVAVPQFPGSNCDADVVHALENVLSVPTECVWHKASSLGGFDAVVIPGGFAFGDYLRCGAIARFSPVMRAVADFAGNGGPVLGICNGFQILCEAGLLPGALICNQCLEFRCLTQDLVVESPHFTIACNPDKQSVRTVHLKLPIAHGAGNYRIDPKGLVELEKHGQILFRYANAYGQPSDEANPNGSIAHIAGVCNRAGNVFGMMPHPERAVEWLHPSLDGLKVFRAFLKLPPASN